MFNRLRYLIEGSGAIQAILGVIAYFLIISFVSMFGVVGSTLGLRLALTAIPLIIAGYKTSEEGEFAGHFFWGLGLTSLVVWMGGITFRFSSVLLLFRNPRIMLLFGALLVIVVVLIHLRLTLVQPVAAEDREEQPRQFCIQCGRELDPYADNPCDDCVASLQHQLPVADDLPVTGQTTRIEPDHHER